MRRRDGFTLIELLIVTLVIGILATVAAPALQKARVQSQLAVLQGDLRGLALAQEMEKTIGGAYVPLESLPKFTPSDGVEISFRWLKADGYAARAEHPASPGWQCWYVVGTVPPGHTRPVQGASRQALCVRP